MLGPANETFFLSGPADACGMTCDSKQTCLSRHGCTGSSMSFETDVLVSPRHRCLGNRVRFKADIVIWRGMDARDHMHSKAQNRCCEMNLRLGENSFLCAALTLGAPSSTSLPTDVAMPSRPQVGMCVISFAGAEEGGVGVNPVLGAKHWSNPRPDACRSPTKHM